MAESSEPTAKKPTEEPRPRWVRWLKEFAIVLVIFLAIRAWQTRNAPSGAAPPLSTVNLAGDSVTLQGPTVVHFWATWCGVCEAMDHNIVALAEDHSIVTVATQSNGASEIESWMRAHDLWTDAGPAFSTVADPNGSMATQWGVGSFPTTFFIDQRGEIDSVEVGYTTELGLRARLWLAQ